ncbi:MAG: FxLYD domain-containing protein [Nanoarchaeota archaeon]
MKTGTKIAIGVFGLIVLLGLMSFVFDYQTGNVIKNETGPLTILSYELVISTDWGLGVKGIAENTAEKQLSYAEIVVMFYDSKGDLLEKSTDSTDSLSIGEKWNFEVKYSGPDRERVNGYEVSVGSVQ